MVYRYDSYKKAGEFMEEAPDVVKASIKIADLEREWQRVAGLAALAEITAPSSCSFSEDGFKITINVSDPTKLMAVQSRRAQLTQNIRKFLRIHEVLLEIKPGKVTRQSTAKPPLSNYMRRHELPLSESKIEEEAQKIMAEKGFEKELAEALAKIKLTSEKLAAHRRN